MKNNKDEDFDVNNEDAYNEYNSILNNLKQNMEDITEIIKKNTDNRKKDIGDRVVIWDFSSASDIVGGDVQCEWFDDIPYLIIIETNKQYKYGSIINYTQDLIVVNPANNAKYRVCSEHVRLLNGSV